MDGRATSVSAVLHEKGAEAWERATQHPMVREIGDGSLPHEKFRYYFEQNVLYLQDYARAIGAVVAKAPDQEALVTLTRFLRQIVEEEIPANQRFLERLGGDPDTLDPIATMAPANYSYTRHLLYVTTNGDCADGLTAILPCQWSYGEFGKELVKDLPTDPVYADWISIFGTDDYDDLLGDTTGLLDRLVDPTDEARMRALSWVFDMSTHYEVGFWDMAYHS